MFELLRSPWGAKFDGLLASVNRSLVICSPYLGRGPCERISECLHQDARKLPEVSILTDLSRNNMLSGATDVGALASLVDVIPQARVRILPSLHAKVYVADDTCAIISSGNLTDSGLFRNFEYGVLFTARGVVRTIREDVVRYAALGSPVDGVQLSAFAAVVADLRQMREIAERSIRSRLRREFDRRLREVDDCILGVRASGRTAHAIFADAILHILRQGPRRTAEIHAAIQRIHPDLCDDTVDRVIDGQHFGKKWKHGVRTAQVFLRRRGEIELSSGRWHLVSSAESSACET